ncbi:MAG: ATP synthase F1 subunit gamma [Chloroflexi bacterium]|nr:ATP synthase F1 subunit gamma [Chloroflexota bacterium]
MPNIRTIRRRVRSVENTAKITRAMEMIAASKMRRAQQQVLAGRPYAEKMRQVLSNLTAQTQGLDESHPLQERREVNTIQLLHITPDRGLAGGLNNNLNRRSTQFILEERVKVNVITIGKKGRDFMVRHGQDVRAVFTDLADHVTVGDILPISRLVVDDYTSGAVDRVYVMFALFVSTMNQQPTLRQLIPVEAAKDEAGAGVDYIYEPDSLAVLASLLPRFVDMQIYQAMLEANASEQSARMVAMRSATDNASEMVEDLTLELNKARQAMITAELLDIVGGVAALEG